MGPISMACRISSDTLQHVTLDEMSLARILSQNDTFQRGTAFVTPELKLATQSACQPTCHQRPLPLRVEA